jgi:hypothetical protein
MTKSKWIFVAVFWAGFVVLMYLDFANGGRFFGDVMRSLGF